MSDRYLILSPRSYDALLAMAGPRASRRFWHERAVADAVRSWWLECPRFAY